MHRVSGVLPPFPLFTSPFSAIAPGQWLPSCGVHSLNRAQTEFILSNETGLSGSSLQSYRVVGTALEDVLRALPQFAEITSQSSTFIRARFYTNTLKWVDSVTLEMSAENTAGLNVQATSSSQGLCPASCPLAPIFSLVFCWVPFYDQGNNNMRLELLKSKLQAVSSAPLVARCTSHTLLSFLVAGTNRCRRCFEVGTRLLCSCTGSCASCDEARP
jgi:hypothetical protein